MPVPPVFRRLNLAFAAMAVAVSLVAACSSDTTDTSSKAKNAAKPTSSSADQSSSASGGTSASGPTSKVRLINVWSSDPSGPAMDVYQWQLESVDGKGVPKYTKFVTNLAYGTATDEMDVDAGGANLQVTKTGEAPDQEKNFNNVQVNSVEPGQHSVLVIGWNPTAGAEGTGGTSSTNFDLSSDDAVTPVDGKVKVSVSLAGADPNATVLLAVAGQGCLGDDGLNQPTVEFPPGRIQIQGIKLETSQPNCQGEVQVPPVTIDGAGGSSWIVTLYGPATAQKLAAFKVAPS